MKECPDCKDKGELEYIEVLLLGAHGSCQLMECFVCGQMMVFDSEDNLVLDA